MYTEDIPNLINLTYLDCGFSKVTKIPASLINLTHLEFNFAKITEIPGTLINLTTMICYNTRITDITKLTNLTHIYTTIIY